MFLLLNLETVFSLIFSSKIKTFINGKVCRFLLLLLLSSFILNNQQILEICSFFSLMAACFAFILSLVSALIVLVYSFYQKNRKILSWTKIIFFSIVTYFFLTIFSYTLLFIFLKYHVYILNLLILRFSAFQITTLFYICFIFAIFFKGSIDNKNKFKLNVFFELFLKFLPPFFFVLLICSLGFLVFSFHQNFFLIFFLALLIFPYELFAFYTKIWKPSIENSSIIWHIFRFSSAGPLILFDLFFSSEIVLAGAVITKQAASPKLLAAPHPQVVKATFVSEPSNHHFILKNKDLIASVNNLVNFSLNLPSNFSDQDLQALKDSGCFSASELNNFSGAEIAQSAALKDFKLFEKRSLIPSDFFFLNENFYVLHPSLTSSKTIEEVAYDFRTRKNKFSIAVCAKNDMNENSWFLLTNIDNKVIFIELSNQDSLNSLVLNDSVWRTDLVKSHGKLLTKALVINTHDLLIVGGNNVDSAVQLKASFKENNLLPAWESTDKINLTRLKKMTLDLILYNNLQQGSILESKNLVVNPISMQNIATLIDERKYQYDKLLRDPASYLNIKIQACDMLIEDFEKINNLKKEK